MTISEAIWPLPMSQPTVTADHLSPSEIKLWRKRKPQLIIVNKYTHRLRIHLMSNYNIKFESLFYGFSLECYNGIYWTFMSLSHSAKNYLERALGFYWYLEKIFNNDGHLIYFSPNGKKYIPYSIIG